jgi:hypothetical protein
MGHRVHLKLVQPAVASEEQHAADDVAMFVQHVTVDNRMRNSFVW